jgi:hypothetical protein
MFGVHGIRFKIGKWINKAEPQEEKPKVHHTAHHTANSHSMSLKKEAPPVLTRHSGAGGLGESRRDDPVS